MEDLLEETPAEQQLTVTEEFLQIIEDFADYIDKFMFEIVTFLAVVDSSMGLVKDLLGLFGFEGWKMAFFPSFSFVVTFSVFLFGTKKRKGKRDEDEGGLGEALNILEDVVDAVEDVAESVEEEIEGGETQLGDNAEGELIKEYNSEEGGVEEGKHGPPDDPSPQSTVRRVIGLVVMTASVVIKLKRSLSKKKNGESTPREQESTKNIEDVSNVASQIRTKMPTEKSGGLNQSYVIPEDVTLEDIKNEGVDIFKDGVADVEKGVASVVGKTSTIVSETLMTAEQQGLQTLDSVSLGTKKLKNQTFAIQEEISSTAAGVLSDSTGVPQTIINTTQNITAVNDVVGIAADMIKKPEESAEKLKAETKVIKNFTLDESTKMAANATATAEAATSKAKEGVRAAKKKSGGIIQIGVRLIRLVVRVANKKKAQTPESTFISSSGQLSTPATVVSAEGITRAACDNQVGGPDVVAALGSVTSGAYNSSSDPASTVKKVVGLLVKVIRKVKKKKQDGGDVTKGSVNVRVVSPDEDSDSVYYDCDSESPPFAVCPRKTVSVIATGTQTTNIQDSSASNFISREEFEELKRALSLGAFSSSVPRKMVPSQTQSQNLQKSFGEVISEDCLLRRSDKKIPKYNTLPDVRKTSEIETAYESPSTLQFAERDFVRLESLYLSNDTESHLGLRSTGDFVLKADKSKGRDSSAVSPISLAVASSLPPHPYFHGNNHKTYSSFDLNAPVVLHQQSQEGLQAASALSNATALRCKSEYSDHSKNAVNIQSTGHLVFSSPTTMNTNSFKDKVLPRKFFKSSSIDIENQQRTDSIPSCCVNGYTASASESSEIEVTKRFQKSSSTSVHFVDERPINCRTMEHAMNKAGLAKGHCEKHRITSQPDLRPASVVVDIPEPMFAIAVNNNKHRNEYERRRSKKHRQKHHQNFENSHIIKKELVSKQEEPCQVSEVPKTRNKKSEQFPLSSYNKSQTKNLRDSVCEAVGKKRFHDKHRSSKRKTSSSRGSKKYHLRQKGEHRYAAKNGKTHSAKQIFEKVPVGRSENVHRSSVELRRHSKLEKDSQLYSVLVPNPSGTTDDVGGESSHETSDDFDPNYESTDYV